MKESDETPSHCRYPSSAASLKPTRQSTSIAVCEFSSPENLVTALVPQCSTRLYTMLFAC